MVLVARKKKKQRQRPKCGSAARERTRTRHRPPPLFALFRSVTQTRVRARSILANGRSRSASLFLGARAFCVAGRGRPAGGPRPLASVSRRSRHSTNCHNNHTEPPVCRFDLFWNRQLYF
nr:hypothetical protein [Pandoravirus massiliensis]